MSSSSNSPSPNPGQQLIDKQMAGVIEAIMIQSFSLANKGLIPSQRQVLAYVESLDEAAFLERIRKHPGSAGTRARQADDAELLRWARSIGQHGVS